MSNVGQRCLAKGYFVIKGDVAMFGRITLNRVMRPNIGFIENSML